VCQRFDGDRSNPYCPAILPLPRDDLPFEPKGGEVLPSTAIGTQDETEVRNGSHVDPPHHVQELDESHCKMLLLLLWSGISRLRLLGARTAIGLFNLWVMKVGHSHQEKRHGARTRSKGP
jgi:hypothetical protein